MFPVVKRPGTSPRETAEDRGEVAPAGGGAGDRRMLEIPAQAAAPAGPEAAPAGLSPLPSARSRFPVVPTLY